MFNPEKYNNYFLRCSKCLTIWLADKEFTDTRTNITSMNYQPIFTLQPCTCPNTWGITWYTQPNTFNFLNDLSHIKWIIKRSKYYSRHNYEIDKEYYHIIPFRPNIKSITL